MIVDVVAGLIVLDKHILVCQRDTGGDFPLKWEFPGGKVENGESKTDALKRELKEELRICMRSAREIFAHRHRYGNDRCVALTFFQVESFTGSLENRIFHRMVWATVDELGKLDFLDGDLPIIAEIQRGTLALDGLDS